MNKQNREGEGRAPEIPTGSVPSPFKAVPPKGFGEKKSK